MLYLIVGFYLFFVSVFCRDGRLFNVNCMIVLAFLALNNYNGFDWISYYYIYDSQTLGDLLSVESLIESTSPGFLLILALAKLFGSYNIVFLLSSVFFIYAVRGLASQHGNRNIVLFMCFCFFGYYYYVERIKQGFSISFVILAIHYLQSRTRVKAWFSMAGAILFHSSAILALPLLAFPYEEKEGTRFERLAGTVLILVFSAGIYLLLRPSLTGVLPDAIGYYLSAYAEQITTNFNLGFFLSIGGLSFIFMLFVIYRVSAAKPETKPKNYAFFIYLFSYVTSVYYGFIRVSNYYYPYMINVLAGFAGARSKNNLWRLLILLGALVQFLRPLSVPYYRDSIMGYQLWGVSDKSPADMQYIRCKSVFSSDAQNELATYSCARQL